MRESLLRSAARYSIGSGVGLVAAMARVALAARALPADARGLWLGLQLIVTYGQHLHCGVLFGMFRNLPLEAARGQQARARQVKSTAFSFVVVMSTIGCAAPLVLLACTQHPPLRYLAATGVLLCLTLLRSYYVTLFKAESEFRSLSESAAVGSIVSVMTLGLILAYGLDGLIWGMSAQAVAESAYLALRTPLPRWGVTPSALREMLSVGVPALGTTLLVAGLGTLDRTIMLRTLGVVRTGAYYIGANVTALMPLIIALPAAVLTPRFFEQFGATGRPGDLRLLVEAPVRAATVALASIVGAGELAIRPVVARIWPNLADGNQAVAFALIASYPLVLAGLVSNVFYALNRQLAHGVILVVVIAGYWIAGPVVAARHPQVAVVAALGCCAQWLYYSLATFAAFSMMGSLRAGVRLLSSSVLPLVTALVYAATLTRLIGLVYRPDSITFAVVGEVMFLIPMTAWTYGQLRASRRVARMSATASERAATSE